MRVVYVLSICLLSFSVLAPEKEATLKVGAKDYTVSELLKRPDLKRDYTKDSAGGSALIEQIAAEACQSLQSEGEIKLKVLLKSVLLRVGQHAISQLLRFRGSQHRHIQGLEMSMDPHLWRRVCGNVQVAPAHLQHFLQQIA